MIVFLNEKRNLILIFDFWRALRVKADFIEEKYQSTNTKASPKFSGCDKQFDMFIENLIFIF